MEKWGLKNSDEPYISRRQSSDRLLTNKRDRSNVEKNINVTNDLARAHEECGSKRISVLYRSTISDTAERT
jgi:hypothetical protein